MSKVGVENIRIPENASVTTCDLPDEETGCKKRVPKRVLHFSDGTIEEYSSDEDSDASTISRKNLQVLEANATHLPWMPWFWYQTVFVGSKALAACDYLGETLANFFGIISPKYEYEIEQYKRAVAEELERQKQDTELGSWSGSTPSTEAPVQSEPQRFDALESPEEVLEKLLQFEGIIHKFESISGE